MKEHINWLLVGLIAASFSVLCISEVIAKDGVYEVVWPGGQKAVGIVPLANRIDTLKGKTVCEVWDRLFRGDEIFPMLEKQLTDKYGDIKFVNYKELPDPHTAADAFMAALPKKLAESKCDAVIAGVGG